MTTTVEPRQVDQERLDAFVGQLITDVGATISAGLVVLGDRLGLYRAMADGAPVTAEQLADRTGTSVLYVRPWLANQAAGGYVEHHPAADGGEDAWSMTPEQAFTLADEESPAFFAGSMQLALGVLRDVPALDDVVPKLQRGARVVDVGCGHGASAILMAQAFPASSFLGVDYHEASITVARRRAIQAGVADRVSFEVADAGSLPAGSADLVAMFDCLHDMGDPESAARAALGVLKADGTLMVVEPMAGDRTQDNLNVVGRVFYGASTLVCTPSSLAQPGQRALGTQAGPAVLTQVLRDAGFSRVRVATSTPVNLVIEARP